MRITRTPPKKVGGRPCGIPLPYDLQLTTPSEYLASHPTQQRIEAARSTWGENGQLGVWLDPSNVWIYPHLHAATRKMIELAQRVAELTPRGS